MFLRKFPAASFNERSIPLLLGGLWIIVYMGFFFYETLDIRHANSDDIEFDSIVASGHVWEYSSSLAKSQGRFYMPFAFGPINVLYSIKSRVVFSVFRAALLLLEILSFGVIAWRVTRSIHLAFAFMCFGLLLIQIPRTFYGLLSYPQAGVGLVLTALVVAVMLTGRSTESGRICGTAAFASCCLNETFIAPLMIIVLGNVYVKGRNMGQASTGVACGCSIFVIIYAIFRIKFGTSYSGTYFSFSMASAIKSILCQIGATAPGFELLINRTGFNGGRFFKTIDQVFSILGNIDFSKIGLTAVGCIVLTFLIKKALLPDINVVLSKVILLGLAGVSCVVPMSFSEKYQVWVYQRQYPYVYSMHCWFFLILASTLLTFKYLQVANLGARRIQLGVATSIFVILCISLAVSASNTYVLKGLEQSAYPNSVEGSSGGVPP